LVASQLRLQQSSPLTQLALAARQAQRPPTQAIWPQHWLLSVQLWVASRQQRALVGDGR
jgi:hypothetical protein